MVERAAVRQGFTIPAPQGGGAVRALHCGADYSKVRACRGAFAVLRGNRHSADMRAADAWSLSAASAQEL
jgi:hypothetical protein